MFSSKANQLHLFSCCLLLLATVGYGQNSSLPAPKSAEETALDLCRGVFLKYQFLGTPVKIYPFVDDDEKQPYRFESEVTLTNTGFENVLGWEVFIGFQHEEIIAEATNVLFTNGESAPGVYVGNGTSVVGTEKPDLRNSIDTAQDLELIRASFKFTGTEFGVGENATQMPLPNNISLLNQGWDCGAVDSASDLKKTSSMWVCCTENSTAMNDTERETSGFLPRVSGDVVMYYDVDQTFDDKYKAKVSISMEDPLGRLDFWNLTWDWRQGEFINAMKGAQILGPQEQDKCVLGPAGQHYKTMDFSAVMSCSSSPTIVDLPEDQKDNPAVAVPNCCRNGTLLPELIDPSQTKSEFELEVFKLPPNLKRDDIQPPANWRIGENFKCSQPRPVSPSEFSPDDIHSLSAVVSWQVVCNKTTGPVKKCCVSFSTFYNDSVIPCPTCACGCNSNKLPWNGQECNRDIPAMYLPYNGVLLPPSNRTALGLQLARLDHYSVPGPVPCPDNCGVAINWHVYSDYVDGWSARITLFNWEEQPVAKWFSAVELSKAMPGFQNVYTFNGTVMSDMNDALLMQGHDGYSNDYLLAVDNKDNPGKLQSLMSFDKRKTPGINVVKGDGFPTRVWFNGEECAIPSEFPTGAGAWQARPSMQISVVVLFVTTVLLVADVTKHL